MHGTSGESQRVAQTSATPGLTVSDALGNIAKRSPVPNVVHALDRFEIQVWVTDGRHGFFHRWATSDVPNEALSMARLMKDAGLQVNLIDLAVARPITTARAF